MSGDRRMSLSALFRTHRRRSSSSVTVTVAGMGTTTVAVSTGPNSATMTATTTVDDIPVSSPTFLRRDHPEQHHRRSWSEQNQPQHEDDEKDDDEGVSKGSYRPSEYFRRYELMTEFINLGNPNHCPLGVYMMPSTDNLNVWYGVLFVHKGHYRSGVFKFRMTIPESYPHSPPTVTFLTDMFHPLVDTYGNVSMSQRFPTWRPNQDYIIHVLHYIKNMFKAAVLDCIIDKHCFNKEAYRLYRNDGAVFARLAQQCAQLSITESFLFDHFPDNNLIRFSPLSDTVFDGLRSHVLKLATADGPAADENE